jgi:hypothetical protein
MAPRCPLVDGFYRSPRLRDMRVELPTRAYSAAHTAKPTEDHPRETPANGTIWAIALEILGQRDAQSIMQAC